MLVARALSALALPLLVFLPPTGPSRAEESRPYPIVDTGQAYAYDARAPISDPLPGQPFFGQDALYQGASPRYLPGEAGTVLDLVTGLEWQRDPGEKRTFREAVAGAARCRLAGREDWRLPSIKELYSLIRFDGTDPDPRAGNARGQRPFLDPEAFAFRYGDPARGERLIDAQFVSSTRYVSTTMRGDETVFGVNFADGRIKGYGLRDPRGRREKTFFVLYVRGNPSYGRNDFQDQGDGTVTDRATGLVWMKQDSGHLKGGPTGDGRMDWEAALAWSEGLVHAGHDDWRLPNAKELQSIVDYARSPDATGSAALDPVFEASPIANEAGAPDYATYWTSTTHASPRGGENAVTVSFGRALGWMPDRQGGVHLLDVHGAGSQRSDPKRGDPTAFPRGRGPQGDVVRILNHVRCVRGGEVQRRTTGPAPPARPDPSRPGAGGEAADAGRRWVEGLDRDGDGRVSRSEFDGPPGHFRDFDRDGDGWITPDEAPTGPPPRGPGPPRAPR